jgi:hypothetical protein
MSQFSTGVADCEKPASSGGSKTIDEFCRDHHLSRSAYYIMKKAGVGPDEMRPHGTIVRITARAEADWQRRGELQATVASRKPA